MAITLNGGTGVITGISVGGLPDGSVTNDDLAGSIADGKITGLTASKLTGALPAISGASLTSLPGVTAKVIGATYDMSTASGTQDITGFGFQPSAVHAFMFINVTDDWCHSFTDFTANRAMHAASTTTAVVYGSVAFGLVTTTADNVRQTANPVTAISDGIRLTWTKQNSPTGTLQQYFIGYK